MALLRKETCNLRHPVGLCHSVRPATRRALLLPATSSISGIKWTLQHTATRCLQHTATRCNTMQHAACFALCCSVSGVHNTLQHTATHCNTLQHCCNTVESSGHEVQHVLECCSVYVQHTDFCVRHNHSYLQHASVCMQHNNFCVQHKNFCLQQSTISMCNTQKLLCATHNTFARNTTTFVCNTQ